MFGAQGNTFQTYVNINDNEVDDNLSTDQQIPSDNIEENSAQSEIIQEKNVVSNMDEHAQKEKLCGYLRKYKFEIYGQMGRMMSTRYRRCWFVLADSTCMLLYYASPQEHTPLGQIDIAAASFSFDLTNRHGQWTFVISSRGQKYCLGANDHQSLHYWLQQLQKRRSEYSQWKSRINIHNKRSLQEPNGGLMGESHTGMNINSGSLTRHKSTSDDHLELHDQIDQCLNGQNGGITSQVDVKDITGLQHEDACVSGETTGETKKSDTAAATEIETNAKTTETNTANAKTTATETDGTNAKIDATDGTKAKPTEPHGANAEPTETKTNGTNAQTVSTENDGTNAEPNATETDGTNAKPTETDGTNAEPNATETDGTNAKPTETNGTIDTNGTYIKITTTDTDDTTAESKQAKRVETYVQSDETTHVEATTTESEVTVANIDEPKTKDVVERATTETVGARAQKEISAERDIEQVVAQDTACLAAEVASAKPSDSAQKGTAVSMRLQNLPFAKYCKAQIGNVVAERMHNKHTDSGGLSSKWRSYGTDGDAPTEINDQQMTESRLAPLKRFLRPRSFNSGTTGCRKCKELEDLVSCEHQTMKSRTEELAATREVMKILQKHIDMLERQRLTQFKFCLSATQEQWLSMLHEKDAQTVQLEHLLALRDEEMQLLREQLKCSEVETANLTQQVSMYEDSIRAKDEVVVSLTHRLNSRPNSWEVVEPPVGGAASSGDASAEDMAERQRLQDACEAFEEQNAFLNSEILELNKLREDDEIREKDLSMKYAEMEASYCQLESKYLLCLHELQKPRRGGDSSSEELVTRLLEDAMESSESLAKSALITAKGQQSPRGHSVAVFDKYGFTRMPVYALDDSLEERAKNLQRLSDKLSSRQQDVNLEISNEVKWETYIVNLGQRPVQRSQELKTLIRSGVPVQHRELIWNACINLRIGKWRDQFGKTYYEDLLQKCKDTAMLNPALKQIELDLLRTLPTNRHYQVLSCEGIVRLRRLLSAYSMHNPVIGYCQGINRLAALALLFLNEEDAFWCLVAIVENIMPSEYYSSTLAAAHADQGVLKELLQEKLPRLHAHLVHHRVDVSLFSFNWFLTVFVDNVPTDVYLRIWDAFLYEGSKVLFRFAVAFFKYNEQTLLDTCDSMSLYTYLRTMPEDIVNVNKLAQIAFDELNPFPMRFIIAKRQTHMLLVKSELKRLDTQRGCTLQEQRKRSDFVSDDEN